MTFIPVFNSLLELDLYKLTMLQAFLHQHPGASGRYAFVSRSKTEFPLAELADEVREQLHHLCSLHITEWELERLSKLRFLKPDFIEFLRIFRLQERYIKVWTEGETLKIEAEGPIIHAMMFETFVLAIVNELYFRRLCEKHGDIEGIKTEMLKRLGDKIKLIQDDPEASDMVFFDFGLRRRFSGLWQDEVVYQLKTALPNNFKGSSNVHLAVKHGLTPIGTMAHEWLQAHQALGPRLVDSQKAAFDNWAKEYRGDLGIALTDVISMDAFLRDFDLFFTKLFDGMRHDSGDPIAWGEKAIKHYEAMGVDPKSKWLIFSDGLNIPKAIAIHKHFKGRIKVSFGIGTDLTCDTLFKALSIVMKILECNGQPVAKLSDSVGKTLCEDQGFVTYLKQVFEVPDAH